MIIVYTGLIIIGALILVYTVLGLIVYLSYRKFNRKDND